jgi:hypothetical protein
MMNAGRPFMVDGADSIMRYIHRTQLPLGMPSGEYQVWMQLVRSDSGEIIPLTNGDTEIQLPDVTIISASCDTDLSKEPRSVTKNIRINQDLELLGYRWREGEYRPGIPIPVDLW